MYFVNDSGVGSSFSEKLTPFSLIAKVIFISSLALIFTKICPFSSTNVAPFPTTLTLAEELTTRIFKMELDGEILSVRVKTEGLINPNFSKTADSPTV